MEFDLQKFLSEMRAEQRADIAAVRGKVEETFVHVSTLGVRMAAVEEDVEKTKGHGFRITTLEKTNATAKWLMRASIVAAIAFIFDMFANHLANASKLIKP